MNPKTFWEEPSIKFFLPPDVPTKMPLPLILFKVPAGFPSPARDYVEWKELDLNEHLIERPSSTFFFRNEGLSMIGAGIMDNSLLIIDRSVTPEDGMIVLGVLYGDYTLKYFRKINNKIFLEPANPVFPTIEIKEEMNFKVFGVLVHNINTQVPRKKK